MSVARLRSEQQVPDEVGGKIDTEDRMKILDAIKEKSASPNKNSATATKEDLNDRNEQRSELEAIVNPITSKLYGSGAGEDDDDLFHHDEL
ncbi:hypothetical protein DFJ73DRAFT_777922 [Zopfochytrium polystomum]|nr:hypothetical protein DFJ73DRAFT_777922 [Zopfochytrium polystomum]